jgi:hypothetical protein
MSLGVGVRGDTEYDKPGQQVRKVTMSGVQAHWNEWWLVVVLATVHVAK